MSLNNEVNEKLLESLFQKERQEYLAKSAAISDMLSKLNISIENLPQRCQELIQDVSSIQFTTGMDQLDPIAISLCQSRELTEKLNDDYVILKLKQKDQELQAKIEHNAKIIEELRGELAQSRHQLATQAPNLETVMDSCRQMKQKVASYEESCERARLKFSKLSVPESAMPASLRELAGSVAALSEEATTLRRTAEDIALVNQARHALLMLKK